MGHVATSRLMGIHWYRHLRVSESCGSASPRPPPPPTPPGRLCGRSPSSLATAGTWTLGWLTWALCPPPRLSVSYWKELGVEQSCSWTEDPPPGGGKVSLVWALRRSSAQVFAAVSFQKPAGLKRLCFTRNPSGLLDSLMRILFAEFHGLIKHYLEEFVAGIRAWSWVRVRG